MDSILIKELEIYLQIGYGEEERSFPQKLLVDLELNLGQWKAGKAEGDLFTTVCYQTVAEELGLFAKAKKWVLLEEFLDSAINMLFETHGNVKEIHILARKFVVPRTAWTGVEMRRKR